MSDLDNQIAGSDLVVWVNAIALKDFWEGEVTDVEVEGELVMLVHLEEGKVKAYQGVCPHQEVMLANGSWDPDSRILVCAGHNWEFDLNTGAGCNPADVQLYEYPVRLTDDAVEVGIPQDGHRHHNRCHA